MLQTNQFYSTMYKAMLPFTFVLFLSFQKTKFQLTKFNSTEQIYLIFGYLIAFALW